VSYRERMLLRILIFVGIVFLPFMDVRAQKQRPNTPGHNHALPNLAPGDSVGRMLHINRIFIIGNRLTRDHIILRELSLKTGDSIRAEELGNLIDQDEKKLFNTHLFNTVEIKRLEVDQTHVDLLIDLNERWYTFPSPIFELSDRNFNEWWQNYNHDLSRVNYGLRLYQFNVRGRNETLRATMQFGFNRVFALRYTIPYIDRKQKHGINIDFDFQESKNLAYQTVDHKLDFYKSKHLLNETRGIGLTYTYRNSFYDRHYFTIEYRQTTVDDTIPKLNQNYLGGDGINQKFIALSYQFSSDHRDVIAYPLKGSYFQIRATRVGFGLDVNKTELASSYAHFFDLKRNFYLSNYTYALWSTPHDQPYNQFDALGFHKEVIRGYEIFVIEGPYFFLNKTTFKKKIFSRIYRWDSWPIEQFRHIPIAIYIKSYADWGYVRNYPEYSGNSRLTDKLLMSAGAGIDVVSAYDLVLRLEYTFNGEGENGFFLNIKKEF
jgi:outer membrane protein assembly factor BamA